MGHDGELAGRQDAAADLAVIVTASCDRNARFDQEQPLHVDHVVPEERRADWRDAASAEPAEDLGQAIGHRADGRHGHP